MFTSEILYDYLKQTLVCHDLISIIFIFKQYMNDLYLYGYILLMGFHRVLNMKIFNNEIMMLRKEEMYARLYTKDFPGD